MNIFQRIGLAINPTARNFIEAARGDLETLAEIRETITNLQLDMEDAGYVLMVARGKQEFTRNGLDLIIEACRLFFLKNPLVRRGCRISSYYVFGRGFDVRSDDPATNEVLQAFFTDPRNSCELGDTALMESSNSVQTDGNLFYCMFPNKTDGSVQVRSIEALEIREIITDPDDASVPWLYKRAWLQQQFDMTQGILNPQGQFAWYPALGYDPPQKPPTIGGFPVYWDNPILHHKEGGQKKWRFGVPRVYPALDWANAYNKLLRDYCKKAENLARFGWKATTKGGQKSAEQIKGTMQSTYAVGGNQRERNPAPQTGATAVMGAGVDLAALRTSGANSDPEEGRRVAHMIYNCFDLPETFFGDVSVGTLATATSLDRPTELAFRSQQEAWEDIFTRMARYVLGVMKAAPSGSKIREAKVDPQKVNVTVSFPAVVDQDMDKAVSSIVRAFTGGNTKGTCAGLIDPKTTMGMLLNILGVDDAQNLADSMYGPGYDPADYAALPDTGQDPNLPAPAAAAAMLEAIRRTHDIARLLEKR